MIIQLNKYMKTQYIALSVYVDSKKHDERCKYMLLCEFAEY